MRIGTNSAATSKRRKTKRRKARYGCKETFTGIHQPPYGLREMRVISFRIFQDLFGPYVIFGALDRT